MSWTKLQLVNQAFAELALAGYEFDITPDEQQTALVRMEAMLADWELDGVRLGYAFDADPETADINAASGLQQGANRTVFLGVAKDIAASFGKALTSETEKSFRQGYSRLLRAAAMPREMQYPSTLPFGAGNRLRTSTCRPFYPSPDTNPLRVDSGGDLDISPE